MSCLPRQWSRGEEKGTRRDEPSGGDSAESSRFPRLRLKAVQTHSTLWDPNSARPVLNVVIDAAIVEAPPPTGARVSYSHVVGKDHIPQIECPMTVVESHLTWDTTPVYGSSVLDNFIGEAERTSLLDAITAPGEMRVT